VTTATISDGRVQHAVLLETFTREGIGTMISREGG
jgi:acetylglutamate kinase